MKFLALTVLLTLHLLPTAHAHVPDLRRLLLAAKNSHSESLLVVQNGKVVVEDYFSQAPRIATVQSVTKSFSSLLIGQLLQTGQLKSLDEAVSQWIPEWRNDPWKSKITVRMLLNHTSGLSDQPASWQSLDFVKFYIEEPLKFEPGSHYEYTTGGVALLAPIIRALTGASAKELLENRLFQPLGITEWDWETVPGGHIATGGGLRMKPRDLAKVGELLLAGGTWKGMALISPSWLEESLKSSQPFYSDYGLLWWRLPNGAYTAQGFGGQYLTIYPHLNLVAVRLREPMPTQPSEDFHRDSFYDFPYLVGEIFDGSSK